MDRSQPDRSNSLLVKAHTAHANHKLDNSKPEFGLYFASVSS